jgi:hypothetical protein
MEVKHFKLYASIFASLSIIFSSGLLTSLNRMKSNYAKIMRHIVVGECIFIFSELMVIIDSETDDYNDALCSILNFLCFNVFYLQDCTIMKRTNYASYFGMQAFSLWLNIFICFEMILILKNPIAQMKSRFRKYYLSSLTMGMVVFFITLFYFPEFYSKKAIITDARIPM